MKFVFLFFLLFNFNPKSLPAQDVLLTKYHDSTWSPVPADAAFYVCDFKKYNELFLCECFWKSSGKLKYISMKEKLSAYSKTIGFEITYFENQNIENSTLYDENGIKINTYKYYENGLLADSVFYNEEEIIDSGFHYFPSGKTKAIYYGATSLKTENLKVFTELGEPVHSLTYFRKAYFGKAEKDWISYIQQNLDPNIPFMNNAPDGKYQVIVKFSIEKDGSVTGIKAETSHGYGMEQEVIEMIKKAPKWNPEIFLGESQQVIRRQPVTFVVAKN